MINLKADISLQLVDNLEEATHVLALQDYGEVKNGDFLEIYDYCGFLYVWDIGDFVENDVLEDLDINLLYKVTTKLS